MDYNLRIYPTISLGLVLLCVLYARAIVKWRARSRGRPLPPGPPALPVVGNLFNIPGDRAWFAFHDLAAQYGEHNNIDRGVGGCLTRGPGLERRTGDIIHFRILGRSTVILGKSEIIREFLEKRAANTSDRPQVPTIEL